MLTPRPQDVVQRSMLFFFFFFRSEGAREKIVAASAGDVAGRTRKAGEVECKSKEPRARLPLSVGLQATADLTQVASFSLELVSTHVSPPSLMQESS